MILWVREHDGSIEMIFFFEAWSRYRRAFIDNCDSRFFQGLTETSLVKKK